MVFERANTLRCNFVLTCAVCMRVCVCVFLVVRLAPFVFFILGISVSYTIYRMFVEINIVFVFV